MRPTNLDSLGFKYKIGDVLIHKGMSHVKMPATDEQDNWLKKPSVNALNCVRLVVLERVAQECPGGVQFKYHCTACEGSIGHMSKPVDLLEEELIPLPS